VTSTVAFAVTVTEPGDVVSETPDPPQSLELQVDWPQYSEPGD